MIVPGAPASRPAEAAVDRSKQAPLVESQDSRKSRTRSTVRSCPGWARHPTLCRHDSSGARFPMASTLLIVERHELPIVTLDLIVKSGETSTPKGKEGLGSIAASLLDEGTKTRDCLQIAGEQAEIGAALAAAGELESTTVSLTTLTRHLDRGLDLYADVILNPSFPEKELQPAQAAATGSAQGPRRRRRADRRRGFPAFDFWAGPSLRPPRRRDAQLGRVDHPGRCRGVL